MRISSGTTKTELERELADLERAFGANVGQVDLEGAIAAVVI